MTIFTTVMTRYWNPACAALLLLLLLGAILPAVAQGARWYKIEMILFTELGAVARNAEHWAEDPGQPQTLEAIPLSVGSARVQALSPSAYRLSGIWSALKRSGDYRPIRHLAWKQPGLSSRSAPLIAVGDELDPEIQGTIKLSRQRFLHLDVDLVLREANQSYRLKSSRRMRTNELHYLDHPTIGVIAIATPLTQ
jgi:hypothetical protein